MNTDYHMEPVTYVTKIDYSDPLPTDFLCFHYKPIETCLDYSYGVLLHKNYKTVFVYATRFEDVITPTLTKESADAKYRAKLESILEEIRKQPTDDILPF